MMMTADERLGLIRIKLERAEKHINDLEEALGDSLGPVLTTVRARKDTNYGPTSLQVRGLYIYNSVVPAIAGDAIHNLRSALDHLAYQLVLVGTLSGLNRVSAREKVQFPIASTQEGYNKRKMQCLGGAKEEALRKVDDLRPYKGGNEMFWLLHRLDIEDKHTTILAVGEDIIMDGVRFEVDNPHFDGFYRTVEDNSAILEHDGPVNSGKTLIPTLRTLAELVGNTVGSFHELLR